MADEPLRRRLAGLAGRRLAQPDQRSCGAAVLVVAGMLDQPSYAARMVDPGQFRAEVLAMHRRTTSAVDVRGRLQVPWPRALGTPPWAVARQLTGTTGVPHGTHLGRWDAARSFDSIAAATACAAVPFYVGSRALPRHVVLALGTDAGRLWCYEPSSGRVLGVDRAAFADHRLGLAGWDVPWFSVQPAARRTPA